METGAWPDRFANYLLLMARIHFEPDSDDMQEASDVVDQAMSQACHSLQQCRGTTDPERAAWLREILAVRLAEAGREHRRDKRTESRKDRFQQGLDRSSARLAEWVASDQSLPSDPALRDERMLQYCDALERLPAAERDVLHLHLWEQLPLEDVASRMNRSAASVKGLLSRGRKRLREQLGTIPGR